MRSYMRKIKGIVYDGVVTELLPYDIFRVRVDNENKNFILGYISRYTLRKIRLRKIQLSSPPILPGDRVKIEVNPYEVNPYYYYKGSIIFLKGRIIFRFPNDYNYDYYDYYENHENNRNNDDDENYN